MKWMKKGLICSHATLGLSWHSKNTMVPVPALVAPDRLRIFLTMCDADNVGRIGYVDVDPDNPGHMLGHSQEPVLDVGEDGSFDDSGVLPSAIFENGGRHYMIYSAYQRQSKVPYSILTGLAMFEDGDFTRLRRVRSTPLLERIDGERFVRSAAFCLRVGDGYRMYYSSGDAWVLNPTKQAPRYDLRCIDSGDLLDWNRGTPQMCIALQDDEYGLTTPGVFVEDGRYKMIYSIRTLSKGYRIGYAESPDGLRWERMDERMDIAPSASGWDSEMICFANMFRFRDKVYLFYCGNHYGMGGMGYAELVQE